MTWSVPTRDDLQRTADILRQGAVPTRWPDGDPGPAARLPHRVARDGTSPPPVFSDNLERLHLILKDAPDVEVCLDEQSWRWTASVPSLTGEDDEPVMADHLGELIPWLQYALEKRDTVKCAEVQSQPASRRGHSPSGRWSR